MEISAGYHWEGQVCHACVRQCMHEGAFVRHTLQVDLEAAVDKALTSTGEPGPAQPLLDPRVPVKETVAPLPVAAKEPSSPIVSPVLRCPFSRSSIMQKCFS